MQNALTPLSPSPGLSFIIACCKAEPDERDEALIRSYAENAAPELLALCAGHGVLPTVYKTLKHFYGENVPENVRPLLAAFKDAYTGVARHNMLMSAELLRIMKLLQESGIEALAFKGPALAQLAYGDITLRQFGDLDILIRREDAEQAAELLTHQGYEQTLNIPKAQEKAWYRNAKDIVLFHPQKGIYVELHWLLLDNDYPVSLDPLAVWSSPQTVVINGQKIPTFCDEMLLYYLCLHGSKHLWERAGWIKDIDLLVRNGTIDWETLGREKEGRRMLLLGLHLPARLFGTPLPEMYSSLEGRWLSKLTGEVVAGWERPRGMIGDTAATLRLFPTFGMKLRYLFKVIARPSKNEYRFTDLPPGWHWLYYVVRPYLLLRKYLGSGPKDR